MLKTILDSERTAALTVQNLTDMGRFGGLVNFGVWCLSYLQVILIIKFFKIKNGEW